MMEIEIEGFKERGEWLKKHPVFFVIAGMMALFIAMGVGRFAYTPILPLMQKEEALSNAFVGFLASSNYAGYLLGAILAGIFPMKDNRTALFRLALMISIFTTTLMGLTHSLTVWIFVRFLSGVASAFVFVLSSSMVLDLLAHAGKTKWSGIFYGGVGLGIFSSGIAIPALNRLLGWQGAWIGLSFISLMLAVLPWLLLKDDKGNSNQTSGNIIIHEKAFEWIPWLIAAYGFEGLGYIVTGTFMVSVADKIPGMQGSSTDVWTLVGLAAVPSCVFWATVANRVGYVRSLMLSMILQSLGIAIPIAWNAPLGAAVGALLFGATFMGITTLATTLARQIIPTNSSRIIGILTAIYGVGQVIGPSVAGTLASFTENYNGALLGASGVVFLGACLLATGLHLEQESLKSSMLIQQKKIKRNEV
jgi:MFS family permease